MRDILDPEGFWLGFSRRRGALNQGNVPPIALNDSLTVFRGQGPIVVAVLDNDADPDGQSLTLVSASAALGTATANPDGTVTYAAPQGTPPGVVEFDTVVYEIADADDARDTGQIDVTITEPVLSVDETLVGTLTVTAVPGIVDITVLEPLAFAGTYQAETSDLLAGPVNLVPPEIAGPVSVGQTLTATPGLWVYDVNAEPVTQSWQWQRGGQDIPSETGPTYVMEAGDNGPGLSVVETLTDAYGARSVASAAVARAFAPGDDPALIGWWDADDSATLTDDGSGNVQVWADKAGGADLVQNQLTRRPQSGVRSLNGRNVLDFVDPDFMSVARDFPASGDVAFHAALIIDQATNAFQAALAVDAANDFQLDANNSAAFDGRLNAAGIGTSVNLSGGPFSGALILSAVFDRTGAGVAEVFISNVSRGQMAYTQAIDASATLLLMTNRSTNATLRGAVAELIITGDIANRTAHHGHLAAKWGLS